MRTLPFAVTVLLLVAIGGLSGAIVHPRLNRAISDPVKVWVFFTDKQEQSRSVEVSAIEYLSPRAVERRRAAGIEFDLKDMPVSDDYIASIEALGGQICRESRWLNGASFWIPSNAINEIAASSFVAEIRPVEKYKRNPPEMRMRPLPDAGPSEFYGECVNQLEMIGATYLHEVDSTSGHGEGVLVGILDSGFRLIHHAFDSLDLVAAWDFLHDDETLDFDSVAGDTDYNGYRHGTYTLGCVAGYLPGTYIGSAYRASVALAKTEDVSAEYITEEDNWVAGIEWLDSLGADIVSSSLGYSVFDSDTPYTFEDMDGNTAITTIAADYAASRGICVANSAGNERSDYYWPHIIAPADGDSVLAVAAVDPFKHITSFSSPGPSGDGRIKPDCAATGFMTVLVNVYDTIGVNLFGSGTSFSCPLIAGLCAAVKSANPDLFGYDLALAVKRSGDRYRAFDPTYPEIDSADNDYGWGVPQGIVAAGLTEGFYGRLIDASNGELLRHVQATLDYGNESRVVTSDTFGLFVDPLAEAGKTLSIEVAGYYPVENLAVGIDDGAFFLERLGGPTPAPLSFKIFPNPATDSLIIIVYNSPTAQITVYSADGAVVHDELFEYDNTKRVSWDLTCPGGDRIANGIYIVRVASEDAELVRKIAVVR